MTLKEVVYMVIDEIKGVSDDFSFTEDHIIFLVNKFRALLLKQRYSDIRKQIPDSNYQEICLDLIEVPAIYGRPCEGMPYLRSKEKVPYYLNIGNPRVYPLDYYQGEIALVSRDRMIYTGYNKFLQNIIYCSIAPDGYLYFKSQNPQFLYLEKVKFSAIFQDIKEVFKLKCDCCNQDVCDILEMEYPLEDALVPLVIEVTVKELTGAIYKPSDEQNNAKDDLENKISTNQR